MPEFLTTREVADYLRLKERKVYDLVRQGRIPCVRVTGRWLFPKAQIDLWLAGARGSGAGAGGSSGGSPGAAAGRMDAARAAAPPPVVAGSHDPLLEWCLAESGCGLALLSGGSVDGLRKLAEGRALVCGAHIFDSASGTYNVEIVGRMLAGLGVVAIEWAEREQGLVLARGNPLGIGTLPDLARARARVVRRQDDAGSHILLEHLLREAGLSVADLDLLPRPAHNETEIGLAVLDGRADVGLAIGAVARQLRLDFLPLRRERYDLVLRRRDYFEEPFQKLLAFARSDATAAKAADLEGYGLGGLGTVRYNAP
jgi:putative molybdopterin biosynthesis protein